MWGVDSQVDGGTVDTFITASNTLRVIFYFLSDLVKISEDPAFTVEELGIFCNKIISQLTERSIRRVEDRKGWSMKTIPIFIIQPLSPALRDSNFSIRKD